MAMALILLASACGGGSDSDELEALREEVASLKATTTVAPTTTAAPTTTVAPTTTAAPTTTVAPTTTAAPTTTVYESVGERNARKSAESYLGYSAFSRSGLIDQLEYEGFTTSQAEYGVDAAGY